MEEFSKLKDIDLDFITGGAAIDKNIALSNNYKETFNSQKCNCNSFKSSISKASLNICDNCIWARSPKENATETYCIQQPKQQKSTTNQGQLLTETNK